LARKILLADDSVTAQNMGKKILSDAGYEVATVSNGSAALKRVQENPPDLIVLDVYMPGYSGLEVCRRLKESASTAHIPVLLTVGKLEPFKPDEARKARAEAFVVKPFEASELLSMVQRLETDPPKIRLEEPKPSRKKKGLAEVFASAAIVEAPDPNAEIDEAGWRDRLSIPHKTHQEPDEAPEVATWGSGSFRDLTPVEIDSPRRDSPFTAEPFVASSIPPTPQDATAEEIAALQAAAAALMGGGDDDAPVAEAAPVEAAPVPTKDVPPSTPEISSTTSEAQAVSQKEAVPATTPAAEPVAATETKSAEPVAKTVTPLVEEAGVIDQSEEPLFARESAPKAQTSSSAIEKVADTKLEPVPVAEKEKAPEEAKKETEAISATPVAAAPVAKKEEAPEQEKKAEQEVASTPVTPPVVAKEKEEAPEAEKKKTEVEVASAKVTPTPVAIEKEETTQAEKKKAKEETASPPAPAPVAKEDEAPKKDKKKAAKKEERRKEAEPEPVPAAVSTLTMSQRWVAQPLPLQAIEMSLALDREMAQFRAAAAALEGVAHAAAMVAETAVAVAEPEPEPMPAPAEVSNPAVQENTVPAVAEAALAAAVGAGSEARPEASAAPAAVPDKPIAEAEMDRRSAAEMKAAWANWREIRESIVGSNMSQQVVDLASSVAGKSEASLEENPEKPAGDPTAIANIVDSVLAELKPKIVEEIAKKLKKS
jgi:CheY-like chemotaxis protein